jgi:hypothetical protein
MEQPAIPRLGDEVRFVSVRPDATGRGQSGHRQTGGCFCLSVGAPLGIPTDRQTDKHRRTVPFRRLSVRATFRIRSRSSTTAEHRPVVARPTSSRVAPQSATPLGARPKGEEGTKPVADRAPETSPGSPFTSHTWRWRRHRTFMALVRPSLDARVQWKLAASLGTDKQAMKIFPILQSEWVGLFRLTPTGPADRTASG